MARQATASSLGLTAVLGFIAGFVAILVFHQAGFQALTMAGLLKANTWSMAPVPPFGVPTVLSSAFWGGLWGALGAVALARLPGPWSGALGWILFAAIVPILANWFVVLPLKGRPVGGGWAMPATVLVPLVYAFWGFGMWVVYTLARRFRGGR